jgi:hypothetical protein
MTHLRFRAILVSLADRAPREVAGIGPVIPPVAQCHGTSLAQMVVWAQAALQGRGPDEVVEIYETTERMVAEIRADQGK